MRQVHDVSVDDIANVWGSLLLDVDVVEVVERKNAAKIAYQVFTFLRDQDIIWFNVLMREACLLQVHQRLNRLSQEL